MLARNEHPLVSSTGSAPQGGEIDDLLLHIKGLVQVRELLRQRGATEAELEAHSAEIGRLLWRLARRVQNTFVNGAGR